MKGAQRIISSFRSTIRAPRRAYIDSRSALSTPGACQVHLESIPVLIQECRESLDATFRYNNSYKAIGRCKIVEAFNV